MKTLDLTLKGKWFAMIASGEKPEEYREIKAYWIIRLMEERDCAGTYRKVRGDTAAFYERHHAVLAAAVKEGAMRFKDFCSVVLHWGYARNRPTIVRHIARMRVSAGNPQWGAETGKLYIVIKF